MTGASFRGHMKKGWHSLQESAFETQQTPDSKGANSKAVPAFFQSKFPSTSQGVSTPRSF